jgi:hypothetical protein
VEHNKLFKLDHYMALVTMDLPPQLLMAVHICHILRQPVNRAITNMNMYSLSGQGSLSVSIT